MQILPAIAPHQQFTVRMTINPAHLAPGQLVKTVSLFVKGESEPAVILEMTGTLLPSLTFDPLFLDYGKPAAGHASPQTLTATLDARLAPSGRWPMLTSSNPDIQITPLPGAPLLTSQRQKQPHFLKRTYRLSLSPHAAWGPIQGTVSFAPSAPLIPLSGTATKEVQAHRELVNGLLTDPVVLLLGEIIGDVTAAPTSLTFGSVQPGQSVTRPLVLTGKKALVSQLQVKCDSPWLTWQVKPSIPAAPGDLPGAAARELEVTLSPQTPLGALHSNMKVMFSNGARLSIPTSAYVESQPVP